MKKRIISFLLAAVMLVGTLFTTSISAEETLYPDVAADRWSAADIAYVTEMGMMKDTGDGEFEPAKAVTRAMVVTVLHRMAGEPAPKETSKFTDVAEGQWYADPVAWGAENELVMGFSDDTFKPNDPVTREQLVTFIGRYAKMGYVILNGVELDEFSDSGKIQEYALEFFKWAVKVGLVKGVTEDEIRPSAGATREQFAAIMHRFDTSEVLEYELKYNTPATYSQWTEKEYPLVEDADFYVAVDGNDSNDGSFEKPFKTFAKAKEAASALAKTATEEVVVAFMAGEYGRLNETFTSENSGTEAAPITYCAYGDGDVVFNNGISIEKDEFEDISEAEKDYFSDKYENDIKKYDLSGKVTAEELANATLFSENDICTIARYPNKNKDGSDNMLTNSCTLPDPWFYPGIKLMPYVARRVNSYHTTEGMIISGHLGWDFYCEYAPVVSYDKETGTLTLKDTVGPIVDDNTDTYMSHKPFMIINVSEELDHEGEYFIDTNTMTLYVYNPRGRYDLTYFLDAFIRCEAGASNLSFVNFDFYCGAGAESRGDTQRPVENGMYQHMENTAVISTATDTKNISFDLCKVSKTGANYAVYLDGHNISFTNSEVSCGSGGGIFSNAMDLYYFDNLVDNKKLIDNNHLFDLGLKYRTYHHAIFSHDYGAVISHNEIHDVSHFAIEYTGINTIMEYNVMYVCCKWVPDAGTVYSGRSLTRVGNEIRYNLFYNTSMGGGFHIYLDDGEAGQTVYGNLFYGGNNNSVQHSGGRNTTISNNIYIKTDEVFSNDPEVKFAINNYWDKYSDMCPDGSIVESPTFLGGLINPYFTKWPTPGTDGEKLWMEKYPWLFNFDMDWTTWEAHKEDGLNVVYPNACYIADSYAFVIDPDMWYHNAGDDVVRLAVKYENNPIYSLDVNPLFVDPTHGDYRIRTDVDKELIPVIPDVPFEKMGRY